MPSVSRAQNAAIHAADDGKASPKAAQEFVAIKPMPKAVPEGRKLVAKAMMGKKL